ncbi:MAG TPA: HIT domain-containing protein [Candidatus Eisenbacteria bacterium]|nr:HIT domain-containing protein [Candidatus Eisenbacteria bacterium]
MNPDRLWAPWRKKFITHKKPSGCIFCLKPRSRRDRQNLVLERGRRVFSMLNLYPYNNGHLMIAPYRHVRSVTGLTAEETAEVFSMMKDAVRRLDRLVRPHGYNIGFNIGRAAGAGYDGHAHLHVVPRWNGDTNFMPVAGGTKVISESLDEMWRALTTPPKKARR